MAKKISAFQIDPPYKKLLGDLADDLWKARSGILFGSKSHDFASTVDAAGLTTTVPVPGAEIGDFAFVSHAVDIVGVTLTAYVSGEDTVSVRFQNESGSTVDLGAAVTLRVFVVPRRNAPFVFGPDALFATLSHDFASTLDGAGLTQAVTVTGAALGDFAFVSHDVDIAGVTLTAYVSAADTVEVRFQNESGSTVDLGAAATLRIVVVPAASLNEAFGGHALSGLAVYDAASLADAAGATTTVTVGGAALGDFSFVSLSLDAQDIVVTSYVSAANTVSVRLQQENAGSAVDLASLTIKAGVVPRAFIESVATSSLVR